MISLMFSACPSQFFHGFPGAFRARDGPGQHGRRGLRGQHGRRGRRGRRGGANGHLGEAPEGGGNLARWAVGVVAWRWDEEC